MAGFLAKRDVEVEAGHRKGVNGKDRRFLAFCFGWLHQTSLPIFLELFLTNEIYRMWIKIHLEAVGGLLNFVF